MDLPHNVLQQERRADVDTGLKSKGHLKESRRFADLIIGEVFGDDQVLHQEELIEVDTTGEIVVPYGDDAKVAVERCRGTARLWCAKEAGGGVSALPDAGCT